MTSSINTNTSAMAAVRALATLNKDLSVTQGRVESGLRVASAKDDPAVFAVSEKMRADLGAMSAVKDSLGIGKATTTVASDAAKKISDELTRLKQTVVEGQQQTLDPAKINAQIADALRNIDAYANSATFNGVNLLGTAHQNLNVVRDIQGNTLQVQGTDSTAAGLNIAGLTTANNVGKLAFDDTMAVANADKVTLTAGGQDYVFEFSDGSAPLTSTADATTKVFDVQITATDSPLAALGKMIDRMKGAGIDASFNDKGEVIIGGNVQANSVSTTVTGGTGSTIGGADGAIASIDAAINTMGNRMSDLGAKLRQLDNLTDFTTQLSDSVKEGLGVLVDADLTEESARLSALQTKQQLAIQSLSIANQGSQALLSLFRG